MREWIMESAVAEYLRDQKDLLPSLYDWKFDDAHAAKLFGISFAGQDWFQKTLELKEDLRSRVRSTACAAVHGDVATYFIKKWGGITRFSKVSETLELFAQYQGQKLMPLDFKPSFERISSWSKWASIVCPEWACIYDARVAYSLNAINYLNGGGHPIFPMPEGRNTRLQMLDITTLLLQERLQTGELSDPKSLRKRHYLPDRDVYVRYLELTRDVSMKLWNDTAHIHEVEMLLFSLADGQVYQDVFDRTARKKAPQRNAYCHDLASTVPA
ncbi:hypothetical protein LOY24_13625 [Pseudomonas putida]|uniref:hypothetical protein n=1 Tax=Pseudomonas putida TaxID=303 RepID=UPI00215ECCF7|nr:hypothetical protein [Pseudomonas putida]UVL81121.1 hypothetical protein LOY24_13625 [Pseudomonas putida]